MQYQISNSMKKALQNEQEAKALLNKDGSYLKNKALQEVTKHKKYIKRKKGINDAKRQASNFEDNKYCSSFSDMEDFQIMQKELPRIEQSLTPEIKKPQSLNNELPPLYKCAEQLKEKVYLLTNGDTLYFYNSKCYDIVSPKDIISIYRTNVDDKIGNAKSLNNISQLHKFLCTDNTIAVDELKNDKRAAVLLNGIYDVEEEKLMPHTHKELVFSYINADYVENQDCPCFEKFLFSVTEGDKILQKRFWQFLGYTFMQTTEAKVFFVMGEAPDSGKSLLGNFIESLYPKKYVSNIALTDFNKSFSVAPIAGSAINISLDLPASSLNAAAASKLKMLTGGDAFNINQKYVPEYRYENRAKLIFASNFPISLTDEDKAFWNRLVYLPFNKSIPKEKQDMTLSDKFQREKNAIVSKALRYAKDLIISNFQFPTTQQIEQKLREWQGTSCSTIENFIDNCCICGQELRGELVDNLFCAYENYCVKIGLVAKNRYQFKQFLQEQVGLIHFKMRDGGVNPQSAFRGIKLIDN